MKTKNCTNPNCKMTNPQPLDSFYKHRRHSDGLTSDCKDCNKRRAGIHSKSKKGKWNPEQRAKKNKATAEWVLKNPTYHKDYRQTHKKEINEYLGKNKVKITEQNRVNNKKRRQVDPAFRAIGRARNRVIVFMRDKPKISKTVGGSFKEFKEHIESFFQPGMTWDNYGLYGWHIDHNFPLTVAHELGPEYFAKACHYKNFRPLWAKDNLNKKDDLPIEFKNDPTLFLSSF